MPFLAEVTRWLAGGAPVLFAEFGQPTGAPGDAAPSLLAGEQAAADYTGRALDGLRAAAGCVGALLWCYADYDAGAPRPAAARRGAPRANLRAVARGRDGQTGRGRDHRARRAATAAGPDAELPWLDIGVDEFADTTGRHLPRLYSEGTDRKKRPLLKSRTARLA